MGEAIVSRRGGGYARKTYTQTYGANISRTNSTTLGINNGSSTISAGGVLVTLKCAANLAIHIVDDVNNYGVALVHDFVIANGASYNLTGRSINGSALTMTLKNSDGSIIMEGFSGGEDGWVYLQGTWTITGTYYV